MVCLYIDFIRDTILILNMASLTLKTVSSSCHGIHKMETFLEILVHADMMESHNSYRFFKMHSHAANLPFDHIQRYSFGFRSSDGKGTEEH